MEIAGLSLAVLRNAVLQRNLKTSEVGLMQKRDLWLGSCSVFQQSPTEIHFYTQPRSKCQPFLVFGDLAAQ